MDQQQLPIQFREVFQRFEEKVEALKKEHAAAIDDILERVKAEKLTDMRKELAKTAP